MSEACVVIPARYSSSRFPGKPLANICGKPMILWVAELAAIAVGHEHVYVATESLLIKNSVEASGFNVLMTSSECLTGTDRICEAAKLLDYKIIVNVQGDEPILNPHDIINCINIKSNNMNSVVNGFTLISSSEDPTSLNIPKVVFNEKNILFICPATFCQVLSQSVILLIIFTSKSAYTASRMTISDYSLLWS